MSKAESASRQQYQSWVEDQIEEFKAGLTRDELLDLAEEAVRGLFASPDGQYPLTEILLSNAVDGLILGRLNLPDYRHWRRVCRSDTQKRHRKGTPLEARVAS